MFVLCLTNQPNAAGQRFMDLVHGEWKSRITQNLEAYTTYNVTAFKGDYVMNVKRNGQVVLQRNFTLDSTGKDITIYTGACMKLYVKYHVAFYLDRTFNEFIIVNILIVMNRDQFYFIL